MYAEKLPKIWSAVCIGLYLIGISYLGKDTIPDEIGLWLGLSALFLIVLVPCLGVPISKAIYHRVRIEDGILRVGRERIPVSDVDPASVHAAIQSAEPIPAQQCASSMSSIDAPAASFRAVERKAPRLVGGGWAVPMGMDSVAISNRRGEPLLIATRDRAAFLTALSNATAAPGRF
ncbi:hypothetical protein OG709_20955 [Streptomyces sp. NBC_01267]|uniref:hypothetical protein n=1 Tax=Streptomyces sp. NBC_01267 TaxID=2903805 RepID=UPI002E326A97|nr:hypothetical protein [Streptomyces sp. NBC_01267]